MISIEPSVNLTVPIHRVVYLHTARVEWPDGETTTVTREEDISYLFTPEAWAQRARDRAELAAMTGGQLMERMAIKLYALLDWIGQRTGWWLPMAERQTAK